MAEEGNWGALGFNNPAPADDVAKYLGEENRGNPVAIGVLKQIASFTDSQFIIDDFLSGINRDCLVAGGMLGEIPDLVDVIRKVAFSEDNRLSSGIYDAHLS